MCIAIFKPADKILSKDTLETCFNANKDGAGYAYAKDGELFIHKGYFTFDDFWAAYDGVTYGSPAIVHFRIATSGNKDQENCHPWPITEDVCIIHNGVLPAFVVEKSPISDTGVFTDKVLFPLVTRIGFESFKEDWVQHLIMGVLGSSKMITLDKTGSPVIFNESAGDWVDGIWFSNTSHKSTKKKTSTDSKEWGSNIHVIFKKGKKYGLVKSDKDMAFLTDKQIRELRTVHRGKVKKLINQGHVKMVEYDADEVAEGRRYELALRRAAMQNGQFEHNESYAG